MSQMTCPICAQLQMVPFLTRPRVPVHQNLLLRTRQAAIETPSGELSLWICQACGFVSNQAFDLAKLQYGDDYENIQDCSPAFQSHTEGLIASLIQEHQVKNCRVVEVGCGKGAFLKSLFQACDGQITGYGFDPSYTGETSEGNGQLNFFKDYYHDKYAHISADIILCRHVIEHVFDPVALLRTIRASLTHSHRPRLFFETPCLEWILTHRVIWDFFYEHCSYFTQHSLSRAFEVAGFQVDRVSHVFEGQYLWLEATLPSTDDCIMPQAKVVSPLITMASDFAQDEVALSKNWQHRLRELADLGKVAIWGAGAKGVTFANLVDPACQWIDCVVDLNPKKQGCFVPGTGHPIVGVEALQPRGVRHAILMNPNYRDENLALLKQAHLDAVLVE
jgi:hypothetical protein